MHMRHFIRRKWEKFLEGPGWIRESHGLGFIFRHYRSPSLKLFFWGMAWYDRIFSWHARLFLIIYVFAFFFSSLSMRSPAITLFLILTALLAADFAAGWVFKPKLNITRKLPSRVRCGIPFKIVYDVTNLRKLPAYDVRFDPNITLPDLRYAELSAMNSFGGKQTGHAELKLIAFRRGIVSIPQGIAESIFPFNLVKHSVLFSEKQNLIVHPSVSQITGLFSLPGLSCPQRSDSLSSPKSGESMDFFGCRQYRPGDPLRKIHWRATARLRQPIVKDFQEEETSAAAIILDIYQPVTSLLKFKISLMDNVTLRYQPEPVFEAAVSMAASIAEQLTRRGVRIRAFVSGSRAIQCNEGENTLSEQDVLDTLALAEPAILDPFSKNALPAIAGDVEDAGMVFLVVKRYDTAVAALIAELEKPDVQVVPILVSEKPRRTDLPENVIHVPAEPLLKGNGVVL